MQNSLGVKTKNLKVENFSNCCIFVRIFSFDLNTIICFPCTIFDILTQNKFMPTFDKYFFLTTNFTIYFSGLIYRYFLCGVLEYVYSSHTPICLYPSLEIYETYVFSHHCGGLKFFFSQSRSRYQIFDNIYFNLMHHENALSNHLKRSQFNGETFAV